MNAQSYIEGLIDGLALAYEALSRSFDAFESLPDSDTFILSLDLGSIIEEGTKTRPTDIVDLRAQFSELVDMLDQRNN